MPEQPDRPLDLQALRRDDALIDAAAKGQVVDPDMVGQILQDWAAMCQKGTTLPQLPGKEE